MAIKILSVALPIAIWALLTLFFPPLVLPTPIGVLKCIVRIVSSGALLDCLLLTLSRLLLGLLIGLSIGLLLGIAFGLSEKCAELFMPIVRTFQSVPPVCWVVLALVWFGFDGKPCIFIVATSSVPTMTISIYHGIKAMDRRLLEMAEAYSFSFNKKIRHIILPSVFPSFLSALEIATSGGWKLVVMGEVLTTSTGIGGRITDARLNLEPEEIIAWAVILVVLCSVTDGILKRFMRPIERRTHA